MLLLETLAEHYVVCYIYSRFEFLQLFYESTIVLSGVYYPISPLMLHHILEIVGHLHSNDTDPLLIHVLVL